MEAKAADPVEFINNSASVGMGLNGINDWSTEFPFLNLMKQSRMWITQCDDSSPAGGCKWNTEEQDKLNLDENKYVKTLPNKDDSSVFYRYVETPFLTSDNDNKRPYNKICGFV